MSTTTAKPTTRTEPTASIVQVTPELALLWLERNQKNRRLRQRDINMYARDMLSGDWRLTGESIKFDRDDFLIDGQHRCHALIQASDIDPAISTPMFVVRGLEADAQEVLDSGAKRTTADSLHLDGTPNSNEIAAAARVVLIMDKGTIFRDNKLQVSTTAEVRSWLAAHSGFPEFVATFLSKVRKSFAPPSVALAAVWKMHELDPHGAEEFAESLHSLNGLAARHPVMTLHKRLTNIRLNRERLTNRDFLALFFQAWNAIQRDQEIAHLPRPRGAGWTATNFPYPTKSSTAA